jgi:beta-glucanase (GH16 family)
MGHGAWPALWLFSDHFLPGSTETHNGELDALEFLADGGGPSDQIATGRATYGLAWQTAHDWTPGVTYNEGVGIPITVGEWHLYAVEWDDQEIRLYIDGCLRNKIRDGQTVTDPWNGTQHTFHIPRDTMYGILMGDPASNASHLQAWYRASLLGNGDPRPDFKHSELQVDYVRYYVKIRD